jgi:hypothetical protein
LNTSSAADRDEAAVARHLLHPGMLVLLDRAYDVNAFLRKVTAAARWRMRGCNTRKTRPHARPALHRPGQLQDVIDVQRRDPACLLVRAGRLDVGNYSEVLWASTRHSRADLGRCSRRPHDFRILTDVGTFRFRIKIPD